MKLKTKLSLLISLLILCIITGISAFLFILEKNFLINESMNQREHIGKGFAEVAKEYFITKEGIPLFNYLKEIKNIPEIAYALVTDNTGKILAHTDIDLLWKRTDDPVGIAALKTLDIFRQTYTDDQGRKIRDISYPVTVGDKINGFVRIGFSAKLIEQSIHRVLSETRNRILLIGFIALIIGIAGALYVARRITIPIQRLAESTVHIGRGELDEHIQVDSHDEIGALAERFNEMTVKLKELDQMKQDFVSSVTHELRSPLTSLGMYIGLFYEGAAGPLNEQTKEYLHIMENNVERLRRFIDNLLDIAKIERGKMSVQKTMVDVRFLVQEVENLFKPHAEQQHITFTASLPPHPPHLLADADKTIQILTNLLSNAFKFTGRNGKVSLHIREENHSVLFAVSDTGIGIAQKDINKIFDKFEQVRSARDQLEEVKGTGLGLAIVKNLVDLQGGKIWVESKPNKGSTFYFTLPKA